MAERRVPLQTVRVPEQVAKRPRQFGSAFAAVHVGPSRYRVRTLLLDVEHDIHAVRAGRTGHRGDIPAPVAQEMSVVFSTQADVPVSHSAHTLHSADLKISSCSSRSIAMASSSPSCSCVAAAIAGASSASINARCGNPRTSEVFLRAGAYRAPRACHRDGERMVPWCACCRAQRRAPRCMAHAAVRWGYPAAVESLETVEFPYRLRSPPLRSRPCQPLRPSEILPQSSFLAGRGIRG